MTAARPEPVVAHYLLDKSLSRFTVRAFASGMLSALGHSPTIAIRNFSGEADFDPANPEQASLHVQIRADSLEVTDDINNKDRREIESTMNQKVLESAKYPDIVFESSGVSAEQLGEGRYRVKMNGNLSLRGVTRKVPLMAQMSLSGDTLRGYGEFSILQTDFDIPLVNVAGGMLKLKDELKFNFDIVAREQG
ncbi:MAG: YceI family protein [Bryobacteraceae bacterium]